uniref:Uncharacterized protein n=1 Tax=Arundo donax TaxID=35708 RepID=A0A0A9GA88_ARUDO
MQLDHQEQ